MKHKATPATDTPLRPAGSSATGKADKQTLGKGYQMTGDDVSARITAYIRERFLDGDPQGELRVDTPLLEWGVLNSMNTALLLMFIREELGTPVPARNVNAKYFKNIATITAMVLDLAREQQTTGVGTE
ncbi:acyl carrier protein [Micromonospora sp. NPDC049204]|uniref:acyl carrier protein n=1 Tax=Micromonospora TaxID=1873 RepID=UPI00340F6474